ncbi:YggS family pyridoxal phosphate-dependent enzyme [Desulfonatronospira sp. MSAO_Bac3]|uniref:YggS family pyridoxal phosphate-dependent enzyme n=1 Tax=Desulfonatronospira sp. MSAO_Bac3 TaxID=2293857 RepID=UPI00257C5B3D|nr:YggS family pyridoxal phosphate-dependent enzyme [Desulfonatronospira sp. MSAO_Bac3]
MADNLDRVRKKIEAALKKSADPERKVSLVAVSKKQPLDRIRALAAAGQVHFGENYVQEGMEKIKALENLEIKWHLIGSLQSNKARFIPGRFFLFHSLDSVKLARALHKKAAELGIVQPVLIQVNLAGEVQKAGVVPDKVPELIRETKQMDHLDLQGLMLMPPLADDPEESRPYFTGLRKMRDTLEQETGRRLPHLSMGMSQDFVQAVEEGATLVRVGSLLMGPRPGCTFNAYAG